MRTNLMKATVLIGVLGLTLTLLIANASQATKPEVGEAEKAAQPSFFERLFKGEEEEKEAVSVKNEVEEIDQKEVLVKKVDAYVVAMMAKTLEKKGCKAYFKTPEGQKFEGSILEIYPDMNVDPVCNLLSDALHNGFLVRVGYIAEPETYKDKGVVNIYSILIYNATDSESLNEKITLYKKLPLLWFGVRPDFK